MTTAESTGELVLLPYPRTLDLIGGSLGLAPGRLILLAGADPQQLRPAAARVQRALREAVGFEWGTVASEATPCEQIGLTVRVAPEAPTPAQGYTLEVSADGVEIVAADVAGAFYGCCTLAQIIAQRTSLPCLRVTDWPDFPARGVMLDVTRDKVPTLETLYGLVDLFAGWKLNQVQLYTEHTFAYRNHPEVWAEASPITGEEVLALDAYCRERQIELVPNQNSFGHMHRWLKLDRYRPLAEVPEGYKTSFSSDPFSLCPLDPGSLELMRGLYDELLPHFSSRQFNVGCDETFDLGKGRSADACGERGVGRVYLDFLLAIYREVKARGRTMQFWGDIIIQHPELVSELPKDTVALEWGYEADHPFAEHGARFAEAGVPFYVCPGTSSWNSIAGRTNNALATLASAAENGRRNGAIGYLNTDWGDNGHPQMLPVSFLGFGAGAALSWALDANRERDHAPAVGRFACGDATGLIGEVLRDLGNVYRAVGHEPHNSSLLFRILQRPLGWARDEESITPTGLDRAEAAIAAAVVPLASARPTGADAALLGREVAFTARLLRHAIGRGRLAKSPSAEARVELAADLEAISAEYRSLWLARNRPGGLVDSAVRLERLREEYR